MIIKGAAVGECRDAADKLLEEVWIGEDKEEGNDLLIDVIEDLGWRWSFADEDIGGAAERFDIDSVGNGLDHGHDMTPH